jgi:hypothetical protein
MDKAGPLQMRPIEKRKLASGRDVGLSKLVADEKKAAVVKSAELREAAALKVAQAGAISRKELH